MEISTLDDARALLYGLPADEFTAARDELTKEMRSAGEKELAAQVKRLRRPSAVAAEVNRIVRADPSGVELILQAAGLLRDAQNGALAGTAIDASDLQRQYRAAIGALAQTAATKRAEVRAALEAATIDEASNDALRGGWLETVPTPPSILAGGDTGSATTVADELGARRAGKAAKRLADERMKSERLEQEQAEQERLERERRLAGARDEHRQATKAHAEAAEAADRAARTAASLRDDLVEITEERAELQRAIEAIEARLDATASKLAAAEQAADTARELTERTAERVEDAASAMAVLEAELDRP